jgi:hypothetical protein
LNGGQEIKIMIARKMVVTGMVVSTALSVMLIAGCDDRTIDKAAQETKEAVDATARASKKASEATGKMLEDAKRGTQEMIEKIPTNK